MLKYGRHLRLDPQTKIVVGRTRQDNEQIGNWVDPQADMVIKVEKFPGPLVVAPGGCSEPILMLAASICAGYSKAPDTTPVAVTVQQAGRVRRVTVLGLSPAASKRYMIK